MRMRSLQVNKKWPQILFLAVAAMVLMRPALAQIKGGCERATISMLVSPDDTWVALVQKDVCSDGFFVTTIVNTVQLARHALIGAVDLSPRPELPAIQENDVFAVEGPSPEQRPLTQWLSPNKLQITVPNLSLIGLKKSGYKGVEIVVKFEPNDPDARERWLQERGLKPK
jgi:hypothetical protein